MGIDRRLSRLMTFDYLRNSLNTSLNSERQRDEFLDALLAYALGVSIDPLICDTRNSDRIGVVSDVVVEEINKFLNGLDSQSFMLLRKIESTGLSSLEARAKSF